MTASVWRRCVRMLTWCLRSRACVWLCGCVWLCVAVCSFGREPQTYLEELANATGGVPIPGDAAGPAWPEVERQRIQERTAARGGTSWPTDAGVRMNDGAAVPRNDSRGTGCVAASEAQPGCALGATRHAPRVACELCE